MIIPFVGDSYTSRSTNENASMTMNFFVEIDKEGKQPIALYGTPGLKLLGTIGSGPIRGQFAIGSFNYVVSGTVLYKVNTSYSGSILGTVTGTGPVSMESNGSQLMIVNGTAGYIVTLSNGAFAQISSPNFPTNPVTVTQLDGYFIVNDNGTGQFHYSTDGLVWAALDFATAESNPDNIVAVYVDHRDLILFGEVTTEFWYSSGVADATFARREGAQMEAGMIAPFSVAKLDNSFVWLGKDSHGQGMVWRANGFVPARISTHAVEFAIQNYTTISDAISYSYQDEGHSFYVLTFPTAGKTWVYDASTQLWHQRGYWQSGLGTFTRHRSNCFTLFNGILTVGDFENGNLYELDLDTYTDNGDTIKAIRATKYVANIDKKELGTERHSRLFIDMETGVGLSSSVWSVLTITAFSAADNTLSVANAYSVGDYVQYVNSGLDIGGLTTGSFYYVLTATSSLVTLSSTKNGTVIDLIGAIGNGTLQLFNGPQAMLRWSDDGGHTWSNVHSRSFGAIGKYKTRAVWRRLGVTYGRVYELSITDPVKRVIIGASLQ